MRDYVFFIPKLLIVFICILSCVACSFVLDGETGGLPEDSESHVSIAGVEGTVSFLNAVVDNASDIQGLSLDFEELESETLVKEFCDGTLTVIAAWRTLDSEEFCLESSSQPYLHFKVAYDAIIFAVSKENSLVKSLSYSDLRKIWSEKSENKVGSWRQVRADWPEKPFQLLGPKQESNRFKHFLAVVLKESDAGRRDFLSIGDQKVIVEGTVSNSHALSLINWNAYTKNKSRLRSVSIDDQVSENGSSSFLPIPKNIHSGAYGSLRRELHVYVSFNREALDAQDSSFLENFFTSLEDSVEQGGYIPLPEQEYSSIIQRAKDSGYLP